MAGGLDVYYPRENEELQRRIARQGLLFGEMPPGTEPQARHFPRRNRIIAGLSLGILVVEAAPKSGSLITARLANEQGREVFAVPGSPLDPRSRGCNELLRQGATLVESAGDVLDALEPVLRRGLDERRRPATDTGPQATESATEDELEPCRSALSELLGVFPVAVDELIRQCQLSPSAVSTVLLELELAGRLERHPGNRVSLIAGDREG